MENDPFILILNWVVGSSYILIFIAMVIEGPIVTAAASFAAALGFFDFWLIFLLSFLGDLTGDIIYYSLGFWGRENLVKKYGARIGLTTERLVHLEKLIHTNPIKTLIITKITPIASTSGLIAAGVTRLPFRKFVLLDLLVTLPNTIFFTLTGFYFGLAFDRIFHYFRNAQYAALIIGLLVISLMYLYKKLFGLLYKDLKKEAGLENGNSEK